MLIRVNAVDTNCEDGWECIKVGVDSCAAISVTPEDTFPEEQFPIQMTQSVGEEYLAASGHTMTNTGQQTVQVYIDDYMPTQGQSQRTQVHRPLYAVSELADNDKIVVFSKTYGDFILCDVIGVKSSISREDGTYHINQWIYKGFPGCA